MNIAVIFAGGTGKRMNSGTTPKQFLELHGKPIIIYTLEQFENHSEVDAIVIACLPDWIDRLAFLLKKFGITKVREIVPGGATGQESIYNGLAAADRIDPDGIVLIHDGVRPLIDGATISACIRTVREKGSAITVSPAIETIAVRGEDGAVGEIIDRSRCQMAKAPQCFYLKEILRAHNDARAEGKNDYIDSAELMQHSGTKLYTVEGPAENIKITTPSDYYVFRAVIDARENSQIFG